ncbi:hypothetical protein PIB30_069773 [Stylosanthes scabra]|uniref:Uncharacterized protein n=1 Tax=Stylosanthes scabra TaxID=79078 RepID=A0ABU6ZM14_9FABA|nr:hypothetical protein [Stylosanthes scabra]
MSDAKRVRNEPETNFGPEPSESDSCPFPPEFGPCSSHNHIHKELLEQKREQNDTGLRIHNDVSELNPQNDADSCDEEKEVEIAEADTDEEVVLAKIAGIKLVRKPVAKTSMKKPAAKTLVKRWANLSLKKQRQVTKPPCILGRTLATRTLRLGAKSKLK